MESYLSAQDFLEIYRKYKNLLYRIAFTYVKNNEDVEDILQEVFIRRLYKAPIFEDGEYEKRWLIKVTVNLCKNHVKSFWQRNKSNIDDLTEVLGIEYWDLDSEEKSVFSEVMSLPAKQRVVIYLHYYEGYSCKEIAEIMKSGESAVKMQLKKGRELLKKNMED
ncbi:MAG: sigma-70 family RNA polymerase sigma factor [Tyzzerella sp.]|nr:sigma-70 family RNA polymerase sigma factor [Tyzzerella sp.]